MAQAELDAATYNLEKKLETGKNNFQTLLNTFSEGIESQQDLDFSMNDNDVDFKKEKVSKSESRNTQYSSTKVKARNLLTNVGYRRFKESDFLNLNFILDILSFLLQNFNPINIDRKVDTEDEQLMINFIWEVCVPYEFATEIYKSPNYQILADPKLTFQKANQIVKKWIVSYDKKTELCKKIAENFKSIHYIYSSLYPKVYSRINQFGIKNKSGFDLAFTYYKVQKQTNNNLKQTNIEVHESEQKPEKTPALYENEKWVLKPQPKPKLPTVRGKAKELPTKDYKQQKAELKCRLEENTEKLEAIKKAKKNFQRKTIVLK